MPASIEGTPELRDLVHKDGVAYEFRPAWSMATGQRVQVGFDVALYGAHEGDHSPKDGEAACAGCVAVWEDLRAIAASAVAASAGDASIYAVDTFRPGVTLAGKRKDRAGQSREDVELVVEIRHRGEHTRGANACEEECLQPVLASLRELGVHEG